MRLTATTIRSLSLPPGVGDKTFFDADLPGFGLRLRASGAQAWMCQYAIGGRTRRVTLGSPATLDPGKARDIARDILAKARLGIDFAAEKHASRAEAAQTIGALLPRYLERQRARLRPRAFDATNRHLTMYLRDLHSIPITKLDRRTIAIRLAELADSNGAATCNRTRTSLSGFCSWAAREGYIEANPVAFTNKAPEAGARERVLSDAELAAIWWALGDDQYGTAVKLLMLTGLRRTEVGGLRWSEIDLASATITIPAARMKNGKEHLVPIALPVVDLLQALPRTGEMLFGRTERGGFRNWDASKKALDERVARQRGGALPHWGLHDFRRSLSTALHERFQIPPHVVETILAHTGHQKGVAGTYNRAVYLAERRRALDLWAAHIEGVVAGQPGNVVPLRA